MTARAVEGLVAKWRRQSEGLFNDRANAVSHCADALEEALAADRAEAGELPELPTAFHYADHGRGEKLFTDNQLRAYGQQCARAASCGGGEWPLGVLNRQKTLDTLRSHNEWRRGAEAPQTDPRILGLALDAVIAYLTTPPTPSAGVEVTEAMVERVAVAIATEQERDPEQAYAYKRAARAALAAARAAALEGGK